MDYSVANAQLWNPIIQVGLISILVVAANVLRRKIPFVRKSLMPTAVIAGFLLLGIKYTNTVPVDPIFLEMLTYHGLTIGFIAMALRVPKVIGGEAGSMTVKNSACIVSTYLIQGFVGLVVSLFLAYTFMPDLFKASGILLPMGFGQGPGQANNIGTTYEVNFGFKGGTSYGLAIAATGYLVACIFGVIYLNVQAKKGNVNRFQGGDSESVTLDTFQNEGEIPISQSIDKLSIQLALILVVYLVTFLFIWGFTSLLSTYIPGLAKLLNSTLWGFTFIFGSLFALLARSLLNFFKKVKFSQHQYQNNYLLNRISGVAFDVMIVSGIATIDFDDISGLWIPFIITTVIGGVVTFVYLRWICKKVYPEYRQEAFLSMFGMLTGTISSGVLLLREIDPNFDTPAANNMITGSSLAVLFGAPLLVLISIAPKSDLMTWVVFGAIIIYFAIMLAILLLGNKKKSK